MALFSWLDPVDEDNVIRDVENNIKQQKDLGKTVTPQAAAKVGEIYRQSPWIPPSVALALAKGNASGEAVDAASRVGLRQYINENNPNKPKRNWFQRNVYDKAKAMSRWAFAGLQLAPDLTQNLASQVFNDNPQGLDGWFASTQLGTMMGNSSQAGSGFFFGGEAAKTQAQRAREFRGTVGNSAWTIGRGAADVFFTPGSKEFNLLSGLVDAAVTVYSDPTTYIGPAVKAAKTGESAKGLIGTRKATQKLSEFIAEKGLVEIDRIPGLGEESLAAAQALARGEAGLNSAEGIAFSNTKFGQWIQNNTKVQRLINDWAGKSAEITRRVGAEGLSAEQAATERGFLAFEIMEQFKGRIDEATALRIAGADDVTKQMGVFGEAAARLSQSSSDVLLPGVISDVKGTGATYALRQVARERLPLYRSMRNSRLFTQTAKNAVIINGSGLDRAQALMNYANYLRGMKLHTEAPDQFRTFMGQAVNAFADQDPASQRRSVEDLFDNVIEIAFERAGGQGGREMARSVITQAKERMMEARTYTINDAGDIEDAGLVRRLGDFFPRETLAKFNPEQINKLTLQGPGSLVELMDNVQFLPDFRRVRALTSNPAMRRVFANKSGNQRAALAITEFVQNEVWKPLALATGGYAMRNMIDAQTRIALAGLKGFFNHPFQYIQQVLGDAAVGGITEDELGNPTVFTGKISDLLNSRDQRLAAFQDAMEYSTYQGLEDPINEFGRGVRNGNFSIEDRGADRMAHTTGMVDNLALIADDPVLRQVVSRQNVPAGQRAEEVLDWLRTDPNGQDSARKIIRYMRGGVKLADPQTGRYTVVKFTDAPEDELLRYWVDSLSEHKVNHVVRGDADLAFVVQHNRVPASVDILDAEGKVTGKQRAPRVSLAGANVVTKNNAPIQPGSLVDLGDGNEGIIVALRDASPTDIDPFTGRPFTSQIAEIQPTLEGVAFTGDFLGSPALRDLIDEKGDLGLLPQKVKRAERGVPKNPDVAKRALTAWKRGTDFFFNGLYGKAVQKLERSIVWRQYFYKEIDQNLDLLAPQEAQKLVDNVTKFAARYDMPPERYVGDKDIWKRIQATAQNPTSEAVGTLEQIEEYASAVAVYNTKELLYNASERSNLEDILRVVVPFAGAWKEVLGTYADFLIEDPTRIRRAQLAFTGATQFDPDNNGEGFFYKDPTSGEYSFNFPGSGWLSDFLTGVEMPLQAPVKRLSIGLGIIPSIGPVAQIAASKIIPDTPAFDEVVKILMPYGRKEGFPIAPTWLKRAQEVISGDTMNMETIYGNTYIETLRALSISGEYDLSDPAEKEKLMADARNKARILSGMRVLGQFIGPTSPSGEFEVSTQNGDIYATKLVQEFYKLQSENYDTAIQRFLEIYGNDALLYISSKSESLAGGMEATEEFGDWERENDGLLERYPDVAGYMAPGGTDFSFEVWNRQLRAGKRRRLTDRELIAQAEYRLGAAQYRALKAQAGPSPTQAQREWLSAQKQELYKQYPGYLTNSKFDPNAFPRKIEQMRSMVADPALADNDVAQALAQYIGYRDKALARAAENGLKSLDAKAAEPLRDWLGSIAIALAQETPEFARIYDRELSYEVEQ